jgi:O-antigen ligase
MIASSYFIQAGHLENAQMAYAHVFSIVALLITVLALVDSRKALCWSMLVAFGAVAFVSLHSIRQQQLYGGSVAGFRPMGLTGDSNYYAIMADLWIPAAYLWTFSRRPRWERVYAGACLVCSVLGVTLASSRGGFMGLAAAFGLLIVYSQRPLRNIGVLAALAVPLLLFAPNSPVRRFMEPSHGDKQAEDFRLITWKAGLRMIAAHPVAGVGVHNFRPLVVQYELPGENVTSLAHNTYIDIGAELGIPGFLVFVGMLAATFWSLGKTYRAANASRLSHLSNIALGLQAGLVSYIVSCFFVTTWWDKMLWLLLCLTISLNRITKTQISRRRRAMRAKLLAKHKALSLSTGTTLPPYEMAT